MSSSSLWPFESLHMENSPKYSEMISTMTRSQNLMAKNKQKHFSNLRVVRLNESKQLNFSFCIAMSGLGLKVVNRLD